MPGLDRRTLLTGFGATALTGGWAGCRALAAAPAGPVLSVVQFGARPGAPGDQTRPIQAAIDALGRAGGGTLLIPGRLRCGTIVISGRNLLIQGQGGRLVDGRLVIRREATDIAVADLGLVDTRANPSSYLVDVSGRNCRFTNVELVKDPIAGGYQMYVREPASGCRFRGLRLRGSNGVYLAGTDHWFEDFEFESTMARHVGGDDAFAIKAAGAATSNIVIRNGIVRGYSAIVSFGSEIGYSPEKGGRPGSVRDVIVENVAADRCSRLAFFKPGALDSDWRNGLVERVQLRNLSLEDRGGSRFRSGIQMFAARGAIIRDVQASGIRITARAADQGVTATAAVDLTLLDRGAPAMIENVDLQVTFADPYAGAAHGPRVPGFPVDDIVKIERMRNSRGRMAGITIDVEGTGSGLGGITVSEGLDGAVTVRRALLRRVGENPPANRRRAAIWSDSRLKLGEIKVESSLLAKLGGSGIR